MNRNWYLCHFSDELEAVIGNCSIYKNQMYSVFWTCPSTVDPLPQKTTRTISKREPWADNYQKTKNAHISIVFLYECIRAWQRPEDTIPAQSSSSSPRSHTQASKSSVGPSTPWDAVWSSRWQSQRDINRTEKCKHTRCVTWISESPSGMLATGNVPNESPGLMFQLTSLCGPRMLNLQKVLNMEDLTQRESENQVIKNRARTELRPKIQKIRKARKNFLSKDRGGFNSRRNWKHSWVYKLCSITYNH